MRPHRRPPIKPGAQHSILLVEDDATLAKVLVQALEDEGYALSWVGNGQDALPRLAGPGSADLVILDLGLPDVDGLDICGQARANGYRGAILMVSARGAELDRVVGLDVGADDYLSKPFSLAELLARVRALLRRRFRPGPPPRPGGLWIDLSSHRAYVGEQEIALTLKEFGLLSMLLGSVGRVVTREQLMAQIWGPDRQTSSKAIDATLSRMRHKLEAGGVRDRIVAVRGVGFRFERAD